MYVPFVASALGLLVIVGIILIEKIEKVLERKNLVVRV